ncbi:uncharacterized protein N7483_006010 [Penicillium malachiteum]|uniref:uncharacterized protein n=1 Tax=Penicillium malachiteum TaxID=1324776 RepID=UPI002548B752|nr:uncharacterized protein N7483_006010 [Penicillium malachiteum]KAJ5731502.1 hypothetical protein N7483_006010 [Penicillium malachiteum]
MHFTSVLAVAASLLSLGLAADPLSFTSWPSDIAAGKPLTLTWTGAVTDQPVKLTLRKGASGDLNDVEVITDQAKDGTFTWTPGENIKEGEPYAFEVSQGGQENYSALLKAGPPANPPAPGTSQTGTATSAPTGAAGTTSQATETGTSSKPLISSSSATGTSSSPASTQASSSITAEAPFGTSESGMDDKKSSDSADVQTGIASVSQYSVILATCAIAMFFYMGF